MATNLLDGAPTESFLLELLRFAGWQVHVRHGNTVRIRARRGEVQLDVRGATLAAAAATVFARAMRSRGNG